MRYDTEELRALGYHMRCIEVFLNGELVHGVIAFDLTAGYVEVYKRGPDGRVVLTEEDYATDILHGNVRAFLVRLPNGMWPHGLPDPTDPRVELGSGHCPS